jgi:glutaredoxin
VTDSNASATQRLILVTRAECELCEDAERDLRRLGAEFELVDVDGDAELLRRYDECVPVLLLDGVELGRAPLSDEMLRAVAQAARRRP